MTTKTTFGISQLLEAEREAQRIIAEARKGITASQSIMSYNKLSFQMIFFLIDRERSQAEAS